MNEQRVEEHGVPGGETPREAQRNLATVIEAAAAAGAAGGVASDVYGDIKAVGKAVMDKFRDRPDAGDAKQEDEGGNQ